MQLLDILVKFKVKVFYLLFTGEQNIGLHEVVLPFLVGVDTLCRFKVFQRRFKVLSLHTGGCICVTNTKCFPWSNRLFQCSF